MPGDGFPAWTEPVDFRWTQGQQDAYRVAESIVICCLRMQKGRLSLLVWGAYLIALGTALLLVPNLLLRVLGLPDTDEVWIRIVGGVSVVVGYYCVEGARANSSWFMRASVVARAGFVVVVIALVLFRAAPPVVALFGIVELAAATWTAYAIGWPPLRGQTRLDLD